MSDLKAVLSRSDHDAQRISAELRHICDLFYQKFQKCITYKVSRKCFMCRFLSIFGKINHKYVGNKNIAYEKYTYFDFCEPSDSAWLQYLS